MGISRDSRHKRRATGGKRAIHQKKRKYELGRPPAHTKLGASRVHLVRCRGGNIKHRALRLDIGHFSWGSEKIAFKSKITGVMYNATSNELVRTNTIVKNTIVSIDSQPFQNWYKTRYGVDLGKKRGVAAETEEAKVSGHAKALKEGRNKQQQLDSHLEEQFASGRLLACITSRPGQSGRADGYILEGKELDFYKKKMDKKRK